VLEEPLVLPHGRGSYLVKQDNKKRSRTFVLGASISYEIKGKKK